MRNPRSGKTQLRLQMLFQKQKKSIILPNYQKPKKKKYGYIMEIRIKVNADSLRSNPILATGLGIFHAFVRVHLRKKITRKKKR